MFVGDEGGSYLKGGGEESMGFPIWGLVLYGSKWCVC
jgi:hypothetical protein